MDVPYLEVDDVSNTSYAINVTELHVVPTELRQDVRYIQVGGKTYMMSTMISNFWAPTPLVRV